MASLRIGFSYRMSFFMLEIKEEIQDPIANLRARPR
jgi:hypothetical protein